MLQSNAHRDISDAGSIEPALGEFGKSCLEDHLAGFNRALLLPPLRCAFESPLSADSVRRSFISNWRFGRRDRNQTRSWLHRMTLPESRVRLCMCIDSISVDDLNLK